MNSNHVACMKTSGKRVENEWKTSGILDIRGRIMYNIEIVKIKLFIRIFKAEFSK